MTKKDFGQITVDALRRGTKELKKEKKEKFADKLAQAMVENLNKEVLKNQPKLANTEMNEKKLKKLSKTLDSLGIKGKKSRQACINIALSLWKQQEVSAKYGFDIKQHWKDMLDSIKTEDDKQDHC